MTDGITNRRATTADAEAIARLRIESWRQSYRGLVPQAKAELAKTRADAKTLKNFSP